MPTTAAFLKPGGGVTAVAIDKDDKNSQYAVRWVVDNLDAVKLHGLNLVHVRTQKTLSPQDTVPKGGRSSNNSESKQLFLPYRGYCARNKIHSNEMILHDLDVASALAAYIEEHFVSTIVLGASNRGTISRVFKTTDVPTTLSKLVADFCSVYVASKDKLHIIKTASRPPPSLGNLARKKPFPRSPKASNHHNGLDDWHSSTSEVYSDDGGSGSWMSSPRNSVTSSNYAGGKVLLSYRGKPPNRNCQSPGRFRTPGNQSPFGGQFMTANEFLQTCNKPGSLLISPLKKQSNNNNSQIKDRNSSLQSSDGSSFNASGPSSWNSSTLYSDQTDESGTGSSLTSFTSSVVSADRDEELQRLRLELKQTMKMYQEAHDQAIAAKMKAEEIERWKSEEAMKKEENRLGESALATVEMEKRNRKASTEASQRARRLRDSAEQKKKSEETRIPREAEEKKVNSGEMIMNDFNYRQYSIEEIESATDYLSPERKIGEGGYGPVYKGYLDNTLAAIKVLRHDMLDGKKQFDKEIEVLSSMRHPYLVLLLGACPEYGCLAYEFMENGSLEDRLFCLGNTPPVPWKIRFKIAAEIASGLHFLHNQPVPLVHRDLKPANILLDGNFVSKIGDVGLTRMIPASSTDGKSQYCLTAAAGTFCYIDPEYQQTGKLGTKSDLYSLGIILLQILTAKTPMGLAYKVEKAIETGKFEEILDPTLKDWPVEEALSLAKLGLQCCELRKKDRPDLNSVILPELERLRDLNQKSAEVVM